MKVFVKIEFAEDETARSLAAKCRGDRDCPWPVIGECPMSRIGIICEKVKAENWKKVMKTEIEYGEV